MKRSLKKFKKIPMKVILRGFKEKRQKEWLLVFVGKEIW
jgi:hypothetical protein